MRIVLFVALSLYIVSISSVHLCDEARRLYFERNIVAIPLLASTSNNPPPRTVRLALQILPEHVRLNHPTIASVIWQDVQWTEEGGCVRAELHFHGLCVGRYRLQYEIGSTWHSFAFDVLHQSRAVVQAPATATARDQEHLPRSHDFAAGHFWFDDVECLHRAVRSQAVARFPR